MSADYLTLKWGTLKGWRIDPVTASDAVHTAFEKLASLGPRSMSAAMQHDTPDEKQALCDLIDAMAADGATIRNDWSGKDMTAEQAKQYVMDYGNGHS